MRPICYSFNQSIILWICEYNFQAPIVFQTSNRVLRAQMLRLKCRYTLENLHIPICTNFQVILQTYMGCVI